MDFGTWWPVGAGMAVGVAGRLTDKLGKGYQGIEQLFKVAIYKHRKALGDNPQAAADMAEKAVFNYAKIPPGIRWMPSGSIHRSSPSPIRPCPALRRPQSRNPGRWPKYAILAQAVEQASRLANGESPEDLAKERAVLPDYMSRDTFPGIPSHLRMPLKDRARSQQVLGSHLYPALGRCGRAMGPE
jgi:hypothetical protein